MYVERNIYMYRYQSIKGGTYGLHMYFSVFIHFQIAMTVDVVLFGTAK